MLWEPLASPRISALSVKDNEGAAAAIVINADRAHELDLLERRVLEALEKDLLTNGRARELLGLSAWDELPTAE